jgi:hypothetical protein
MSNFNDFMISEAVKKDADYDRMRRQRNELIKIVRELAEGKVVELWWCAHCDKLLTLCACPSNGSRNPYLRKVSTPASIHAQALGKLGGKIKSAAKAKAARKNGRKGGRPKKVVETKI